MIEQETYTNHVPEIAPDVRAPSSLPRSACPVALSETALCYGTRVWGIEGGGQRADDGRRRAAPVRDKRHSNGVKHFDLRSLDCAPFFALNGGASQGRRDKFARDLRSAPVFY